MKETTSYLSWHYFKATRRIIEIGRDFLIFFSHYFSVGILLKTLFYPWKRQSVKRKPGLSFSDLFYVVSFNIISRSIGAIVRILMIICWILMETWAIVLTGASFLIWLITPGFSLPIYWSQQKSESFKHRIGHHLKDDPNKIFQLISQNQMAKFVQGRLGINLQEVANSAKLTSSSSQNLQLNSDNLTPTNILTEMAKDWPPFKLYLDNKKLTPEDVAEVVNWYERQQQALQKTKRFWELENLMATPGIGKSWIYGYTPTLDQYTEDLALPQSFSHHLVGREKITNQIQQVLARTAGNSVLLVGKPGVGRHTIIYELANKIRIGKVIPSLANKRMLSFALGRLLAESKTTITAKGVAEDIITEAARAGNVVLVIDDFDQYVSSGQDRLDLTGIISKTINKGIQIVGLTTFNSFAKYLQPNAELMKYFQKVEAYPPTDEEALVILEDTVDLYEKKNQVWVTYSALKNIIEKVDQYVIDIPFPEKAIDLLDEASVFASQRGIKVIEPDVIDQVIAEKTKIPIGKLQESEIHKLNNLETVIHQRLINQEQAVNAIASALRRSRVGIAKTEKPIGTFLFLGPTGVGKTETAKALAEAYFGSDQKMIRFDMSEYQGKEAIERIIGSTAQNEPGLFAKSIRKDPFSLLLLDEIEKAHPDILNLFLVMLDEGYFTDTFGEKIDCRNLIIIGTSNAGTELIRQKINENLPYEEIERQVVNYIQKEHIFSPEFINRFDSVVIYQPLNHDNLMAIARLMIANLNKRLAEKEISVKITDGLIKRIAELGYNPSLGARPMNRVIQDKIEDQIAQKILKGELKKGEEIEINL